MARHLLEDSLRHQDVEVGSQLQRRAEALDEGFGFLATSPRRAFAFDATPAEQANVVSGDVFSVERRSRSLASYCYVADAEV